MNNRDSRGKALTLKKQEARKAKLVKQNPKAQKDVKQN